MPWWPVIPWLAKKLRPFMQFLDSMLHWGFAQVGIPMLSGVIGAIMLALEHYRAAEWCFAIAGTWGLLSLWRAELSQFNAKGERTATRIIGTLLIAFLVVWIVRAIYSKESHPSTATSEQPVPPTVHSQQTTTEEKILDELKRLEETSKNQSSEPFLITAGPILDTDSAKYFPFFVAYQSTEGPTVSPVRLAVFLGVINHESASTFIDGYTAEVRQAGRGQWSKLNRVSAVTTKVYAHVTNQPGFKGLLMDDNPFFDRLINLRAVRPNEPVLGWALFDYPEGLDNLDKTDFKISIYDTNGKRTTTTIRMPPVQEASSAQYAQLRFGNKVENFSSFQFRPYGNSKLQPTPTQLPEHPLPNAASTSIPSLKHPVIAIHHTEVIHDDQHRTIDPVIALYNISGDDVEATVQTRVFIGDEEIKTRTGAPDTSHSEFFPASTNGETQQTIRLGNTLTLSPEIYAESMGPTSRLRVEVYVTYPDRGAYTQLHIVGLVKGYRNFVDITSSSSERVKHP